MIIHTRLERLTPPDHSTLCRFRDPLAQDNLLEKLRDDIHQHLAEKAFKIETLKLQLW